jgi:hypothetical protein
MMDDLMIAWIVGACLAGLVAGFGLIYLALRSDK